MKTHTAYIAIGLGFAAGLLWFLGRSPSSPQHETAADGPYPFAIIEDMHSRHFTVDGTLLHELNVKQTEQYQRFDPLTRQPLAADMGYALMIEPELRLFSAQNVTWTIHARQGEAENDGSELDLLRSVKATHTTDDGSQLTLTTEQLHIDLQSQTAHSSHAVRVESPQGVIEGIGLEANLKTSSLKLLSNVHGTYFAPAPN